MKRYSSDLGLLILRVGIGVMFMLHGLPKILQGPARWEGLAQYGLPFLPEGPISVVFGLAAALSEFAGGLLLVLGLFHRVACLSIAATMAVAFVTKLGSVATFNDFAKNAGWPLELLIVAVALFVTGPGRYVIRKK